MVLELLQHAAVEGLNGAGYCVMVAEGCLIINGRRKRRKGQDELSQIKAWLASCAETEAIEDK